MTAARLEELAVFAGMEAEWSSHHGNPQRTQDYADLARCARAWAAVEKAMANNANPIELMGYRGRITPWSFYLNGVLGPDRYTGSTAIEAVEAAEVKP